MQWHGTRVRRVFKEPIKVQETRQYGSRSIRLISFEGQMTTTLNGVERVFCTVIKNDITLFQYKDVKFLDWGWMFLDVLSIST